jgi:hypothetical protein
MKKISIIAILVMAIIISSYSIKSPLSNPNPPTTNTGAPTQNRTCVRCHSDFTLNTAGGSITATGLPVGSYVPGQVYNFSVTISNATPMQVWAFAMKAVISGTSGTALGTFSTANANVNLSAGEIRNTNGASFTGTSYTYNNLSWTAPSTGTSNVSFYVAGVAGDNDGSEAGDYVYSNTYLNIVLPVSMGEIKCKLSNNTAIIEWSTYSESGANYFDLERSSDGRNYEVIKTIAASGNSSTTKYYKWIDNGLPTNKEVIFYRIKMVDQNGKFEYSKVISLKPSVNTYIENIYPTVITGNELVKIKMVSNTAQSASIKVFSPAGQLLSEQVQMLQKGGNEFLLNKFISAGRGVYILKIKAGNFSIVKKLMVQ